MVASGGDQVRVLQRVGENAVVPQAEIASAYEVRNDVAVVLVLSCRDIVEFNIASGQSGPRSQSEILGAFLPCSLFALERVAGLARDHEAAGPRPRRSTATALWVRGGR